MEGLATSPNGGWEYTSFFGPQPLFLLFVVFLTSLGTWGLPQMVGKFYAIKNEDAVKKGTVISTLFAIVVAGGCYFLGGFGRLYPIDVAAEGFDAVIPKMISTLSPALIAIRQVRNQSLFIAQMMGVSWGALAGDFPIM